ncbi:MAG: hypothetical protein B6230_01685 [Desulfobacteraceae bacterium 4572_89]|nr:MAG: hypothetical protein B6230_01685 [Desulfobacteraceae bacterium 4572_89]
MAFINMFPRCHQIKLKITASRIKLSVISFIILVIIAVVTCIPGFAYTSEKTNILIVFSWHKNMPH